MYKDLQIQILQEFAAHDTHLEYDASAYEIYAFRNSFGAATKKRPEFLLEAVEKWTKDCQVTTVEELRKGLDLPATRADRRSLAGCLRAVGWRRVGRNGSARIWVAPTASAAIVQEQEQRAKSIHTQAMRERRRNEKRLRKVAKNAK